MWGIVSPPPLPPFPHARWNDSRLRKDKQIGLWLLTIAAVGLVQPDVFKEPSTSPVWPLGPPRPLSPRPPRLAPSGLPSSMWRLAVKAGRWSMEGGSFGCNFSAYYLQPGDTNLQSDWRLKVTIFLKKKSRLLLAMEGIRVDPPPPHPPSFPRRHSPILLLFIATPRCTITHCSRRHPGRRFKSSRFVNQRVCSPWSSLMSGHWSYYVFGRWSCVFGRWPCVFSRGLVSLVAGLVSLVVVSSES